MIAQAGDWQTKAGKSTPEYNFLGRKEKIS